MRAWQRYLAEVFGTFMLVFVGATAVVGFGASAAPFGFGIGLGWAIHGVVVKGDTDLRGNLDQLRTDAGGGQAST